MRIHHPGKTAARKLVKPLGLSDSDTTTWCAQPRTSCSGGHSQPTEATNCLHRRGCKTVVRGVKRGRNVPIWVSSWWPAPPSPQVG